MSRPRQRARHAGFFALLTPRAKMLFFGGVFLLFGPFVMIYDLATPAELAWYEILPWFVFSGLVAVGWAYGMTLDRRVLFVTVPLSFLLPMFFGSRFWARSNVDPSLVLEAALCMAVFIGSYVLFVIFISREGDQTFRLRTEISLAREIHDSLVPPIRTGNDQLEVLGESRPTTEVGGDLLDIRRAGESTDIYVADVTGHGVSAGLLMGMIKSAIRMKLLHSSDLESLTNDLNEVLFQVQRPGMFATFAALEIRPAGDVYYLLAGHHPVLHHRAATGELTHLPNHAPPLGVVEGFPYRVESTRAEPGDLFVILTDGLTEVFDDRGDEFGLEGIERAVRETADQPLASIHAALFDAVHAFGSQDDDQTLVLVRVKP